jgi:alkyl hydroperoxide reductase subunit AhpC
MPLKKGSQVRWRFSIDNRRTSPQNHRGCQVNAVVPNGPDRVQRHILEAGGTIMVMVGVAAPKFDCRAVVRGVLRRLRWQQVHENKTLLLLFESHLSTAEEVAELRTLNQASGRMRPLWAKVAVVCRAPLSQLRPWVRDADASEQPEPLAFPLIVDADGFLAWRYDLLDAEGRTLWGQVLIDRTGIVRQTAVSCFPVTTNVDDLVRNIQSVAHVPRG